MIPARTVTFLFTDIEDSTRLWEQHREAMQGALARHDRMLRQAIEAQRGVVFKTVGDAFCAAFGTAADALAAALAAQRALAARDWGDTPIRVRMALHTGVAEERDDDFFGPDVNRVARLLSTGRGGQVLLSGSAQQLLRNQLPAECEIRQLGRYQLKGLAQPERIYQIVGPGLLADFSPLAAVGARFDNLPEQTTRFVGRETELAALAQLLADPAVRLVTLLGQGGAGKTRLAIETARAQADGYQNGVLFAPLEAATSHQAIVNALAEAIGFQFRQGGDLSQQLRDYLHEKEILLVLDNFDQALDSAGIVSDFLRSAPRIKALVTSREKLNLSEETLFRLEGLDYSTGDSPADALAPDAPQLFLQGARRVRPGFDPEPGEVEQVARICRLVDGLPLGILLAAAWMEILSPLEIGDEIAQSLDFLSTDMRNVPARHRSVRAVIESTWRQLGQTERDIFARLSVFQDGFTREAAQDVTGASLRQLMRIANKSLILRDQDGRFRIHQLPLQFAREMLAADPVAHRDARVTYSRYYAGLLAQLSQDHPAEETTQLMNLINQELPNIRAAWRWVAEQGESAEMADYSAGLGRFYDDRGWYLGGAEDKAIYQIALRRVEEQPADTEQWRRSFCSLHEILADIAGLSGDYEDSRGHYDAALARLPEEMFVCLARLKRKKGNTFRIQMQFDNALDSYRAAEAVLGSPTTRDVRWWQEWIQIQLERTWLSYWQGAWDAVTRLDEEIRPQVERFGTLAQQVNFFNALAAMSWRKERYSPAKGGSTFFQTAYKKSLESGNPHDIAWSAFTHGFGLLWYGEYDRAEELMQDALALAQENGDFVHQARCLTYLTILYRKRGQVELVRRAAEMSLKMAERVDMLEYVGTARGNMAWLAWHDGDDEEVATQGRAALESWARVGTQHASIAFKWVAIWPLMALALKREGLEEAVGYAVQLLLPDQQQLPQSLWSDLEDAVQSWAEGRSGAARSSLLDALAQSDLYPGIGSVSEEAELRPTDGDRPAAMQAAHEPLTPRESEVLGLIAAGLSNKEIAEQLVVEVSTVKKHINHLFSKLDVHSRTRAIVRAQELGLL